jgi:hypothetical protein
MSTNRAHIDGLEPAGRDAKGRFQRGHKGGMTAAEAAASLPRPGMTVEPLPASRVAG